MAGLDASASTFQFTFHLAEGCFPELRIAISSSGVVASCGKSVSGFSLAARRVSSVQENAQGMQSSRCWLVVCRSSCLETRLGGGACVFAAACYGAGSPALEHEMLLRCNWPLEPLSDVPGQLEQCGSIHAVLPALKQNFWSALPAAPKALVLHRMH